MRPGLLSWTDALDAELEELFVGVTLADDVHHHVFEPDIF
jgi:hypothetical protein